MDTIKEFIREVMRKQGLSQNELSARLGLAKSTMSQYVNAEPGHHPVSFLVKLADYTDEDIGKLASLSLGRPVRFDIPGMAERTDNLSYEDQVIADINLLLYSRTWNRDVLDSVFTILKYSQQTTK